jgi:pimeloyl-ACP methyl ester carboxylesterase
MKSLKISSFFSLFLLFAACQKESITLSTNANDLFFVKNKGASMPVLVEGNTAQKAIILVVHGGPGSDAMKTMNGTFMDTLEQRYAVAYWDQRNAGSTQGGANHADLNIATMTEDLQQVVLTLKHRYGQDKSVFLYGHSFGGALSASFLTTSDNQKLVKAWINIDGAHSFPLIDTESKKMINTIGTTEKNAGNNVAAWTSILDYTLNNDPRTSLAVSEMFNTKAYEAIKLMKEVNVIKKAPTNDLKFSQNSILSTIVNFQSVYFNSGMADELFTTEFTTKLNKVTIPVLCLFGKYDFVVPPALADDVINKVSSVNKKKVIFNNSGHDPYLDRIKCF